MAQRWRSPKGIAFEGVEVPSSNGMRVIDPGATTWRELPVTLRLVTEDFGGHDGAAPVGAIDLLEMRGGAVYAEGPFSADPAGVQAALWVDEGVLRGVSIDPGDHPNHAEYIEEIVDPATGAVVDLARVYEAQDQIDAAIEAGDEAEAQRLIDWLDSLYVRTRYTAYEIGAATIVAVPAFADATIELAPTATPVSASAEPDLATQLAALRDRGNRGMVALQASGRVAVMHAPWYQPQSTPATAGAEAELKGLTQWTITDDGRMCGHLWDPDSCHRSYRADCVKPPPRGTDFKDFHVGTTVLDDGSRIRTGVLTFMGEHAPEAKGLTREQMNKLMEDTGKQLGTVRLYEDEFGVQACGQIFDDVSPTMAARALAGWLSYDLRPYGGKHYLFGLHTVNTPGHPWYEEEGGEVVRMVASAGPVTRRESPPLGVVGSAADCGCGGVTSCTCDTPRLSPLAVAALAHLDATHDVADPQPPSAAERLAALTG
jgi:hypothetical protein